MGQERYFQLVERYNQVATMNAQAQTASSAALPVVDRAMGYVITTLSDTVMLFTGMAGAVGLLWSGSLVLIEAVPQLPAVCVDIGDVIKGSAAVGGLVTSVWAVCRVLQPQKVYLLWQALREDDYESADVVDNAPAPFIEDDAPRAIGENESEVNVQWRAAVTLWRFTCQQREYEARTGERLQNGKKPWARTTAIEDVGLSRREYDLAIALWIDAELIKSAKEATENPKFEYRDLHADYARGKRMMYEYLRGKYIAVNGGQRWLAR